MHTKLKMTQEELQGKERKIIGKKKVKHYAFVFFTSALAIVYFASMLPPKETKTVQGTAMNLTAIPDGAMGDFTKLFVQLEDGKEVIASITKEFPFKAGAKVKVLSKTSYLGFSSYSVIWDEE